MALVSFQYNASHKVLFKYFIYIYIDVYLKNKIFSKIKTIKKRTEKTLNKLNMTTYSLGDTECTVITLLDLFFYLAPQPLLNVAMNSDNQPACMRKLSKMCFCSMWNIDDTSECTFKNISSMEACNLEDVLYD